MSRYITAQSEEDILLYLSEWKTGRYGKKLTWAILSKSFGYSRQALSCNENIKSAYDEAKGLLKNAESRADLYDNLEKENKQLKKKVDELLKVKNEYEQKYIRWQINAQLHGVSVSKLNMPVNSSLKEDMRRRSED